MTGARLGGGSDAPVAEPGLLEEMGAAARAFAKPGAARRAAEVLESFWYRRRIDTAPRKPKQYNIEMFFKPQPVHFVGIGGIGMSGLAEVLLELGYRVTGSDLKLSPDHGTSGGARRRDLRRPRRGESWPARRRWWSAPRCDPTIRKSSKRAGWRFPVIPRGELLAELMRQKFGIAVAGSHGKTTTTSMVAADSESTPVWTRPSWSADASASWAASNARLGKSDYLVVERDESDGSFLKLAPIVAVVTNIDREHLDHYSGIEEIRARVRRIRRQSSVLRRGRSCAWTTKTSSRFCPR